MTHPALQPAHFKGFAEVFRERLATGPTGAALAQRLSQSAPKPAPAREKTA